MVKGSFQKIKTYNQSFFSRKLMKIKLSIIFLALGLIISFTNGYAKFKCNPKINLQDITSDTLTFMDKVPTKFDKNCNVIKNAHSFLL